MHKPSIRLTKVVADYGATQTQLLLGVLGNPHAELILAGNNSEYSTDNDLQR